MTYPTNQFEMDSPNSMYIHGAGENETPAGMKIRLFITDDHYMVIEGIRSLLEHEKNVVWMGHGPITFIAHGRDEITGWWKKMTGKSDGKSARTLYRDPPGVPVLRPGGGSL